MLFRNARTGALSPRTWFAFTLGAAVIAAPAATAAPAFAAEQPADALLAGMVLDDRGVAIVTDVDHTVVAPGLDRVSLRRVSPAGPLHVEVLVAQLGADSPVRADYLYPGVVSKAERVRDLIARQGAVAGVNGSFFDINNTNAPNGVGVSAEDGLVTIPDGGGEGGNPVVFGDDGLGSFASLMLEGTADFGPAGSVPIAGVNTAVLENGHVALFNSLWGEGSRARVLRGDAGVEVWTVGGKVTKVTDQVGSGTIPDDTQILVARAGAGAETLAGLAVGGDVSIEYGLSADAGNVVSAIGANQPLLEDGVVAGSGDTSVEPRTGVGFSDDGGTMYLAVVDGRQTSSIGMTLPQFGQLFADLGADDAVNLDGGGSSTILAREAGNAEASLLHNPSDGEERLVPNGLGLFVEPGSGQVDGYRVVPEHATDDAERVFPGLHRTFSARGYDEMFSPVADAEPDWSAGSEAIAVAKLSDSSAAVEGRSTGWTTVTAATGDATGSIDVRVLGPLQRVSASASLVALVDRDASRELTLVGHDDQGYEAPIDPSDVTISGGEGVFAVEPGEAGTFRLRPLVDEGGAELHFDVQGKTVDVAVTVGLTDAPISSFEDAAGWRATGARSTFTVNAGPGRTGGNAVHVAFDYSQQPGTRTTNALPPARIPIAGQPQKLRVWAKGTSSIGSNAMTYLGYRDANGSTKFIYSNAPLGDDWQQIEFPVPEGTAYPIEFTQVATYETNADKLYTGEMWFDDLTAEVAPDVELPVAPLVTTSLIAPAGATEGAPLRVAVMSDSQFVARDPESGQVEGAHRTLQEIVAAKPDLMLLVGDFVDEASPADFDLAKQILDEELAGVDFPWYYIPGNHEIMGTSDLTNFRNVFGEPVKTVDHDETRFILLDTSTGALSKNFDQVRMLRDQLDAAATDPEVTGVVVVQHMPIDDPLINKASQLVNRQDAELERDWLEGFREDSGKSIALVSGHVGDFHSKVEDGIPYIINGNSGKTPSASPEFGEFTGWTMLGIDPLAGQWRDDSAAPARAEATSGNDWIAVETQARVDELTVAAPEAPLEAGESFDPAPTITQDETRTRDVAWPMSWVWSGDGLFSGDAADAPADAIAAVDPATHRITALHAGSVAATLTVNGVSRQIAIEVVGGTVSVSGEATFGETLQASLDGWALPAGATVEYRWLRDGEPVSDAHSESYVLGVADVGASLSVEVTVAAPGLASVTAVSAATAQVRARTFDPLPEAAITGEPRVGETLTATSGDWSVDGAQLAYAWLRDGEPIVGADGATYVPVEADLGARLSVVVTAAAPGYETASVTSAPTAQVAAGSDDPTPTDPTMQPSLPAAGGAPTAAQPPANGSVDDDLAATGGTAAVAAAVAALLLLAAGTVLGVLGLRRRPRQAE